MLVVLRGRPPATTRTSERRAHTRGLLPRDASAVTFLRPELLPGGQRAVRGSVLVDSFFAQLPSLIPPGDLLVLNTTRVRHARLLGTRPSGAPAEVLLIHPCTDGTWVAMGKPGSALQPGKRIALGDGVDVETIEVLPDGHRLVRFLGASAEDAIARYGRLPLPPYITRDPTEPDEDRYQTVYARARGQRRGADRGPALHSRDPGFAVRERGAHRRTGPPGGPGHLQAGGSGRPRRAPDAPRALRDQPAARRDGRSGAGAGRQHLGRRYDGRAGARERGRTSEGWFAPAPARPA